MNNIMYALMILVLWLMLLHYPFLLGSVQTQNKLVPALRQPAYAYKKGTKRQDKKTVKPYWLKQYA